MPDLLYEIGTEQLPAAYLEPALEQLKENLEQRLTEKRLKPDAVHACGTPRRLTVAASDVPQQQEATVEKVVGPPKQVGFDEDGNPTEAAKGFARSQGVEVEDLMIEETDKGPYVAAEKREEGQPAEDILPDMLEELTREIRFPKSMHWTSGGMEFARPVRWLVALLGSDVLGVHLNSVQAGRETRGHMFMAPEPFPLEDAELPRYKEELRERYVVVDPDERRDSIREQISEILEPRGHIYHENGLLDEVANMVEYPCVAEGSFDDSYLKVPDCVLAAAMTEHQRYFPVYDGDGSLVPRFLSVVDRGEEQSETVVRGNERVLRARLEDAKFFWNDDRKKPLAERVEGLKDVVFLQGLGNDLQRAERLEALCEDLAERCGLSETVKKHSRRAAHLSKADLLTDLVGEFPTLQGVVGRELALADGEDEAVADAIAGHYRPTDAGDELPERIEARVLGLSDRLDMMCGCFALGLEPTGSKDPYALRRRAQGILRLLEDPQFDLPTADLLELARRQYENQDVDVDDGNLKAVEEFLMDRLYQMALDRGHSHDFIRAVLAAGTGRVAAVWRRLSALEECSEREWWPSLVELVDRTYRIQKDSNELPPLDLDLLEQEEEKEVGELLQANREAIESAFREEKYLDAAELYCEKLSEPVHVFFDEVFVNVDDEALKKNRKALCRDVYRLFADNFADLYRIEEH